MHRRCLTEASRKRIRRVKDVQKRHLSYSDLFSVTEPWEESQKHRNLASRTLAEQLRLPRVRKHAWMTPNVTLRTISYPHSHLNLLCLTHMTQSLTVITIQMMEIAVMMRRTRLLAAVGDSFSHNLILFLRDHTSRNLLHRMVTFATSILNIIVSSDGKKCDRLFR